MEQHVSELMLSGLAPSPRMGDHQRLEARLLLRNCGLQQQDGGQEAGGFVSQFHSLSFLSSLVDGTQAADRAPRRNLTGHTTGGREFRGRGIESASHFRILSHSDAH